MDSNCMEEISRINDPSNNYHRSVCTIGNAERRDTPLYPIDKGGDYRPI